MSEFVVEVLEAVPEAAPYVAELQQQAREMESFWDFPDLGVPEFTLMREAVIEPFVLPILETGEPSDSSLFTRCMLLLSRCASSGEQWALDMLSFEFVDPLCVKGLIPTAWPYMSVELKQLALRDCPEAFTVN